MPKSKKGVRGFLKTKKNAATAPGSTVLNDLDDNKSTSSELVCEKIEIDQPAESTSDCGEPLTLGAKEIKKEVSVMDNFPGTSKDIGNTIKEVAVAPSTSSTNGLHNLVNRNTPVVVVSDEPAPGPSSEFRFSRSSNPIAMLSCSIEYHANKSNAHWMVQAFNVNSLPFMVDIRSMCAFADDYPEISQISVDQGRFEFRTSLLCEDHPRPPFELMGKLKIEFQHQNLPAGHPKQPFNDSSKCSQILWTR